MIGLDTNVLLRYLVRDDPAQTDRATQVIETGCTPATPGYVNFVVLSEFAWVLEQSYRYPRWLVRELVARLLDVTDLRLEAPATVRAALQAHARGGPGLADHLIVEINRAAGCETTVTFDRRMGKLAGAREV